jgi:hypothetical protein
LEAESSYSVALALSVTSWWMASQWREHKWKVAINHETGSKRVIQESCQVMTLCWAPPLKGPVTFYQAWDQALNILGTHSNCFQTIASYSPKTINYFTFTMCNNSLMWKRQWEIKISKLEDTPIEILQNRI